MSMGVRETGFLFSYWAILPLAGGAANGGLNTGHALNASLQGMYFLGTFNVAICLARVSGPLQIASENRSGKCRLFLCLLIFCKFTACLSHNGASAACYLLCCTSALAEESSGRLVCSNLTCCRSHSKTCKKWLVSGRKGWTIEAPSPKI